MLTDTKLRNPKPRDKLYKVNDRDGLYVAVTPTGSVSFRYHYSINGRQETITFGRYDVGGISLAEARERLNEAKRMVADGKSPAKEKARKKAPVKKMLKHLVLGRKSGCEVTRWRTPPVICVAQYMLGSWKRNLATRS